ncbi:unnamed protein product [Penicillium salamii]|uniref:Small-subunit processome Utp21 domain-containing protein n=1 Tax=Penicillium salamii TaxID=1612424 RepID=A0A9W4NU76_9EURO|nr:unnamed protein product [Penicillium salamii]CAG8208507.1 unnamed protein product [Penicillium salamii]CAG8208802.1 unnamed protein product [Penicillium salamii]CAG8211460.1 unnamed protein product [Penicillium salamii]CAG8216282.1 unnamed protein product [Penicillium salamii]
MPANETFDLPLAKRQKRVSKGNNAGQRGSKIFAPFRTLGLVSPTPVPFTSVRLGKSTYQITTSVGHSLQTYDLRKGLNLIFLSRPQTPEIITATCAWQDKVFAAWGHLRAQSPGGIWVFKRGKKVAALTSPADLNGPIERLVVFGSWVVGCWAGGLEVWKTGTYEHYASMRPQSVQTSSQQQTYTGVMCNMPTYINKIFVGRSDGAVDIWNLRTGKLIHTLSPSTSDTGPVTAIQPTPALSLVAVAYKSGALSIQNVSSGQPVLRLKNASSRGLPVTSISFRSDGLGAGHDGRSSGVMATVSSGSGDITLWDLNNGGRIAGILRGAHRVSSGERAMGANRAEFLDGQPVIVSSGDDNSLKTWIFDATPFSPIPRPLHIRNGHSAAVSALEFLPGSTDGSDSAGKWLLSASKDCSLWGLSLRKDSQHTEISQGNVESKAKKAGPSTNSSPMSSEELKAPEITCISSSLNRDGGMGITTSGPIWSNPKVTNADASNTTGWESVVTGHRGDKFARTWFWGKKKAGRWAFATSDGTEVKSVVVSHCGTFAVIGSAGGSIDMYNMQSGQHRQSFPARQPASRSKINALATATGSSKHTKAVTGLMVDSLNRTVVSCSLDGKVKFWDLLSGKFIDELDWNPMTAITGLRYNKASELVAFSCDDLSIRVIDLETRKLVREFWGCVGQVNDFIFSNDGRWIIAASMDSVVRVWDLPTAHLVDIFRVSSTCVALSMSSTGEFLATAHAGGIGISLWSNRSLFMPISTKNLDESIIESIGLPATSGEGGAGLIEAAFVEAAEEDESEGPVLATEQLSQDMMTLSLVPKSRWQALIHLDTIRERNRPKEAPKAPEKAPFFLPSLLDKSGPESNKNGTDVDADLGSLATSVEAERLRIAKVQNGQNIDSAQSLFTRSLASGHQSGNFDSFVDHLKSLPPAKADLEIRSLDPRVHDGHSELSDFVTALTCRLKSKRDFELVNAWMAVFLKIHSDTVSLSSHRDEPEYRVLQGALAAWAHEQEQEGKRLAELVGYCRGVVGFLRSAR